MQWTVPGWGYGPKTPDRRPEETSDVAGDTERGVGKTSNARGGLEVRRRTEALAWVSGQVVVSLNIRRAEGEPICGRRM